VKMAQKKQTSISYFMKISNCRSQPDSKQDISSCITSELEDTSRSLSSPSKKRAHSSMISSIKNTDDSTPISDLVSKTIVADSTNVMNIYDIGFYINRTLSQNEISDVMNNLWVPDINYKFPIKMYMKKNKQVNLKFQYSWLLKYPWLCYSEKKYGAFCKFCVAFVKSGVGYNSKKPNSFVVTKFDNWRKAL